MFKQRIYIYGSGSYVNLKKKATTRMIEQDLQGSDKKLFSRTELHEDYHCSDCSLALKLKLIVPKYRFIRFSEAYTRS